MSKIDKKDYIEPSEAVKKKAEIIAKGRERDRLESGNKRVTVRPTKGQIAFIKAEVITLLTKATTKQDIYTYIESKYNLKRHYIVKIYSQVENYFSSVGAQKLRDAQTHAIGEMEYTKSLIGKHVEVRDDESGAIKLDKEAMRLFLEAQKHQHKLLGLDKMVVDIHSTGGERLSDAELIEIANDKPLIEQITNDK